MRIIFLLLTFPMLVFSSVTVNCPKNQSCQFIKSRLELVVKDSKNLDELKEGITIYYQG